MTVAEAKHLIETGSTEDIRREYTRLRNEAHRKGVSAMIKATRVTLWAELRKREQKGIT